MAIEHINEPSSKGKKSQWASSMHSQKSLHFVCYPKILPVFLLILLGKRKVIMRPITGGYEVGKVENKCQLMLLACIPVFAPITGSYEVSINKHSSLISNYEVQQNTTRESNSSRSWIEPNKLDWQTSDAWFKMTVSLDVCNEINLQCLCHCFRHDLSYAVKFNTYSIPMETNRISFNYWALFFELHITLDTYYMLWLDNKKQWRVAMHNSNEFQ